MAVSATALKTSIDDITAQEKNKTTYRNEDDSASRIKKQKQEFFTLLTVQLKNQDPMSPMDSNEMTRQVFAINQVEQQLETNRILGDINKSFAAIQTSNHLNYIGKVVSYPGSDVMVENGTGVFNYDIAEEAISATIEIKNSYGQVIHSENVAHGTGPHSFEWRKPAHFPDGIYSFNIVSYKSDDNYGKVKTYGSGRVNSVLSNGDSQLFEVNNKNIPSNEISRVTNPSVLTDALLHRINTGIEGLGDKIQSTMTQPLPDFSDPSMMDAIRNSIVPNLQ